MTEPIDIEEIERSAFRSYFEDGLWEIYLGTLMVTWGVRTITDIPWFTLMILFAIPIIVLGKQFITVPRLGNVVWNKERVNKRIIVLIGIMFALLTTVGIIAVTQSEVVPDVVPGDLYFAIMVVVIFGLMAYLMEYWKLAIWGVFMAIGMLVSGFVGSIEGAWVMLVLGILTATVGLILLAIFLRKYPKLVMEEG